MRLEDILSQWDVDAEIDGTNLGNESLKISKKHSKYYRILTIERVLLQQYEAEFKEILLEKWEFYIDGESAESIKKGWNPPHKGKVLKSDVGIYLDADRELLNLSLKIGLQKEKIKVLEDMIKIIHQQSYHINSAIEYMKFQAGEG